MQKKKRKMRGREENGKKKNGGPKITIGLFALLEHELRL